ncbi:ATP-binding protein [Aquabacterium sp.]|uniref:ATP-binding protein n=1 Tax=Aquabacterium sp. TaxID=1872578 RepID=UPI003784B94F
MHRLVQRIFSAWRKGPLLRRLVPHSLRAQFAAALFAMGALIVAGGATAVFALHATSSAARQFSQERLARMQNAQDLQQRTQQIQLLADRMLSTDSDRVAHQTYAQILAELDALDELTARLAVGEDVSVLDLHQSSQLFRNSAHVIAHLREAAALPGAADVARTAALASQREEMRSYAQAMTVSARERSDQLTRGYQAAVLRVVNASNVSAYWVVAWLAFGLLAAWLIARVFLGQHVIARLQQVSRSLREAGEPGATSGQVPVQVPVQGDDEIGAMARAVEQFLCDRRQLAATRVRLEEEQQRLAAIIDNTADSIVVLQAGKVLQLNHAAERMFGLHAAQAVGQPGEALLPDLDWQPRGVPGLTRDALARGSGGEPIPVEVSLNPVSAGDGGLLVLVIRDATLRKEAEQHLIAARDAAEAARATQAAFLANMSHELRTPLNAVLGYAQLLELDSGLSVQQRRGIETIRRSGDHLLALINDLLDLAKHDAGKLELCLGEVQLAECVRVTADIVRVKAVEAGLRFTVDVAPDVPAEVIADEKRLRQVLLNLLSNAVKFTDRGEVALTVRVLRSGAHRVRLHFSVRDTGVGIREDQLEKIFRPFEQVGDVRHRTAGSGLGLAISRQLVRLMGGDIQVRSEPGRGTDFSFELDLALVRAAADEPAVHPGAAVGAGLGGGPRARILVVDDMPANRQLLCDMLRPLGFEIDEAGDGQQALALAGQQPPDLVIMDVEMPVMGGLQAIGLMRGLPALRGVRIIAVSATVDADAVSVGPGQDADAFLAKPLDRERLLREIARQIGPRQALPSPSAVQPL